ncbi:hypothetical protein ABH944_004175 [Caballeronia udeis]|uniref:Uncharacterized protein n=1 Tax=Caballeronia udeis TaxID=1232866 RepID=A0ABW8MP36_9BURK
MFNRLQVDFGADRGLLSSTESTEAVSKATAIGALIVIIGIGDPASLLLSFPALCSSCRCSYCSETWIARALPCDQGVYLYGCLIGKGTPARR